MQTGADVRAALGSGDPWYELQAISPVVIPTDDLLARDDLDGAVARDLPHLREVFRRPHTRLETLTEPQPVGRVKRVASRAPQYLATHPQDWHRRKVDRVVPRRVLSRRFELDPDVYENRVAARLADRLTEVTVRRLQILLQVHTLLERVANFSNRLQGGFQVRLRLTELWGQELDVGFQEAVRSRRDTLQARLRTLGELRDSELYRSIPARAPVEPELRRTNVLSSHQSYRRVAALWRVAHRHGDRRTRGERLRDEQALSAAYDLFVLVLAARALARAGFACRSATCDGDRARLELHGPRGEADLTYNRAECTSCRGPCGASDRAHDLRPRARRLARAALAAEPPPLGDGTRRAAAQRGLRSLVTTRAAASAS